ncbi:unnamed protein product, partial [Prunus brigantina]
DVEDEYTLDNIESSSIISDFELKGGSHAEREPELDDGDAGYDGHDGDVGDARDAGGDKDTRDARKFDPDAKVDVFRLGEAECQYFVNEIDLIHYNSGQELKDGIKALLQQENARLHETYNTPLIAKFTFTYSAVNGDEWIELPINIGWILCSMYAIFTPSMCFLR